MNYCRLIDQDKKYHRTQITRRKPAIVACPSKYFLTCIDTLPICADSASTGALPPTDKSADADCLVRNSLNI